MAEEIEPTTGTRRDFVKGAAGLAAVTAIAAATVASAAQPASAASTMTVSIDGIGQSAILAFSWGASNTVNPARPRQPGVVAVQDLSLTRYLDASSPLFFKALVTGARAPKANVTVTDSAGNASRFDLENVLVSSQSTGGSGGEDRLTENISLSFTKLTFTFGTTSAAWPA
jgi:type VI secretion system secreted protein Hcp